MSAGKILLLGDINIDTVWPVPEFPIPGRDGLVPEVYLAVGGAVVNSAYVLHNLGVNAVLLGCVGKDVWGEKIKQDLSQTTINTDFICEKNKYTTGLTFIIATPDGERTMFSSRGANVKLDPQAIEEKAFLDAKLLHISGYALLESPQRDAVWRAVELAKRFRIPVSLDTGLEPVVRQPDEIKRILPFLSVRRSFCIPEE